GGHDQEDRRLSGGLRVYRRHLVAYAVHRSEGIIIMSDVIQLRHPDPVNRHPDDLHETPPAIITALRAAERLPFRIWEPACGPGAIVRTLRAAGHDVYASDRVDYGHHQNETRDFVQDLDRSRPAYDAIVTNPPYRRGLTDRFVSQCLEHA